MIKQSITYYLINQVALNAPKHTLLFVCRYVMVFVCLMFPRLLVQMALMKTHAGTEREEKKKERRRTSSSPSLLMSEFVDWFLVMVLLASKR
ncbi:MAG: hypothetical protein IMZ53_15510 [Thermoplasmata archaeon]|nr:hypothetical protein [Thermoplasmata archaeon]